MLLTGNASLLAINKAINMTTLTAIFVRNFNYNFSTYLRFPKIDVKNVKNAHYLPPLSINPAKS